MKKFLSLCCGLTFFMTVGLSSFSASSADIPANAELAQKVPIADMHMHIYGEKINNVGVGWFLKRMDENNVRWGGGVGNLLRSASDKLGDRYIATIGQREFFRVFKRDSVDELSNPDNPILREMLDKADKLFARGRIKGIGEIHTNNLNSGPPFMRRKLAFKNNFNDEMLRLANKYNGFVQFHTEFDTRLVAQTKYFISKYPRAIIIFSHCIPGSSKTELEKILQISPNVMCEISGANGPTISDEIPRSRILWGIGWGRMYGTGGIRKQWKDIIEKYPNQFMVGSDSCCDYVKLFPNIIKDIRRYFLAYLSEETLKKVAYQNAAKRFDLK